jgi:hypothetical protein
MKSNQPTKAACCTAQPVKIAAAIPAKSATTCCR